MNAYYKNILNQKDKAIIIIKPENLEKYDASIYASIMSVKKLLSTFTLFACSFLMLYRFNKTLIHFSILFDFLVH